MVIKKQKMHVGEDKEQPMPRTKETEVTGEDKPEDSEADKTIPISKKQEKTKPSKK